MSETKDRPVQLHAAEEYPNGVPMNKWGKDHWSTFAFIETRAVDHRGDFGSEGARSRMRCNPAIHPGLCSKYTPMFGKEYPTRLNDGTELYGHDDWSCAEDAERAGLLTREGSGVNPIFRLTLVGYRVAAALREHKARGGNFGDFNPLSSGVAQ